MAFAEQFESLMQQTVRLQRATAVDAHGKPAFAAAEILTGWRWVEDFQDIVDERGQRLKSSAHGLGPPPANGITVNDTITDPYGNVRRILRVRRTPDADGTIAAVKVWTD